MLRTMASSLNNETIGMTAEFVLCLLFNIPNSIERHRWDTNTANTMITSNLLDMLLEENVIPMEHVGGSNGPTDFMALNGENETKTMSLKTLKKSDGKICPQGGQPTYKSFDKHNNLVQKTADLTRIQANQIRWNWIQTNIGTFLNEMQRKTFCCDYLLLLSNCSKQPKAELLQNKHYDFTKFDSIEFGRQTYEERPHSRKPGQLAEFYSTVIGTHNNETKKIGEFQIHFKSRLNIKFRFFNSLFRF